MGKGMWMGKGMEMWIGEAGLMTRQIMKFLDAQLPWQSFR